MSNIKERILGAITVMTEADAKKLWKIITEQFPNEWDNIESVEPDEWDLELIKDIENNPDCNEFIPIDDAMKELGLL
ncbi:hypothetical protein [Sedimentibacter sp.]|uniref:hypothetical protein n=1 Tax=Sedimentibacter sp. TaxID=1960295 RepID=UPI0028A88ACC|nr:hypothetical protein [Sedimentibacter sp.]